MSFREAFQNTDVGNCIQPGIRALGNYSRLIESAEPARFDGSIDIDDCLVNRYPQDHRWDYAFGYGLQIYYVEVHHVSDSEVSVVISKYHWLRDWQNRQPNPALLKQHSSYHWVSSGKGSLTKNSRFVRSLISAGMDYPSKTLRMK